MNRSLGLSNGKDCGVVCAVLGVAVVSVPEEERAPSVCPRSSASVVVWYAP